MNKVLRQYRIINILNLDVAMGAAGMSMWVNYLLNHSSPIVYYYLIFSVVWTIYLLDHLYDAKKHEAISERRKYFKKNAPIFRWVLGVNILLSLGLFAFNFNMVMLLYALPAFGITCVYMLANWLFQENKQRFYLKEILISLGYALGIMVIPLSIREKVDLQTVLITLFIVLMALWNLLIIARFELEIDRKEGQTSLNQWISIRHIQWINYGIYSGYLTVGIIYSQLYTTDLIVGIIFVIMAIYMVIPFIATKYLQKGEKYHRYVDMVFLWSLICLFA
jgi:4-hydroxybenzoate polyprenyltransferase